MDKIQQMLDEARRSSVQVYQRRQQIQGEVIRAQQQAALADQELVRLDGVIGACETLIQRTKDAPDA